MLFHSLEFLILITTLVVVLCFELRSKPKKLVLLLASYLFYMWWNPAFILLLLGITIWDYTAARLMAANPTARRRKLYLALSISGNLVLLAFFKYAGFLQENMFALARLLGCEVSWTALQVTLPVGISFMTFQSMSYTIDVYRGRIEARRSPLDYALFVAFFPQLVAGPIVRAEVFLPQLDRPLRIDLGMEPLMLIARGLAKKVLIADNVAVFVDAVFKDPVGMPSVVIWAGAVAFAVQIYCDFSGYSDIAIGVAKLLGFDLPVNFRWPYFARNPSDFWRRWHISLSSWLRDYLYIGLGGNRGSAVATYRNLMITMLLGGLWHGASWSFVLWGAIHGVLLCLHRLYTSARRRVLGAPGGASSPLKIVLSVLVMQYLVVLAWIPFRIRDPEGFLYAMKKFVLFDLDFALANLGLGTKSFFSAMLLLGLFLVLHVVSWRLGGLDRWLARRPAWALGGVGLVFGFSCFYLWPLTEAPFIYFQF